MQARSVWMIEQRSEIAKHGTGSLFCWHACCCFMRIPQPAAESKQAKSTWGRRSTLGHDNNISEPYAGIQSPRLPAHHMLTHFDCGMCRGRQGTEHVQSAAAQHDLARHPGPVLDTTPAPICGQALVLRIYCNHEWSAKNCLHVGRCHPI